jgi:hypothetical protein
MLSSAYIEGLLFRQAHRFLGSSTLKFLNEVDRQMDAKVVLFATWVAKDGVVHTSV